MFILPEISNRMFLRMLYEKAKPFLLCILIVCVFALGLYLGGTCIMNKTKALKQEMEKTREMLQKHPSSVVLINCEMADAVDFKPRNKWDRVMEVKK